MSVLSRSHAALLVKPRVHLRKVVIWTLALLFLGLASERVGAEAALDPIARVAIRAGLLFEGDGDTLRHNVTLLIERGRIVALGEKIEIPQGTRIIDLPNATVLPGLIDLHVHLLLTTTPQSHAEDKLLLGFITRSSARKALDGLYVASLALRAGFTTLRVPGDIDPHRAVLDIRDSILAHNHVGPRIFGTCHGISRTGGNADNLFFAADIERPHFGRVADGADALVAAVREEVRLGADFIKLYGSGGSASGLNITQPTFAEPELTAAINEAHRLGKRVAVHALGDEAIQMALRAGADTIEHAYSEQPATFKLAAQKKAYFVLTLYQGAASDEKPGEWLSNWRKNDLAGAKRIIRLALQYGVRIGYGTDAGPHFSVAEGARQFGMLVESGLTAAQAIRAATSTAASALGQENDIGALRVGMRADIIAVAGNPLKDIALLEHVPFVMKDGVVIKDELHSP